jgi:hypothetical protein
MIEFRLCRIAIIALTCLVAVSAAGAAGGPDSDVDPVPRVPAGPAKADAETPSDSADATEICDCGARSPGELAETQRQMLEWQAKQAP